jgi:hypoxanthine phosphoribosyltransferase
MTEKFYIDTQGLLEDSFRLAANIYSSGFRPTFIVAIWRGGTPIGVAVQEFFSYAGVRTNNISIRTSSYHGIDSAREVRVYGLSYLVKNLTHEDRLLIVDDVFDTGHTIEAILRELSNKLRLNMPADTRVAVPYYKPKRNKTSLVPDYYLHETEVWLKYPHSLEGLTRDEIATSRPEIYDIIKDVLPN